MFNLIEGRHRLVSTSDGIVRNADNTFLVWDDTDKATLLVPDSPELRAFFDLTEVHEPDDSNAASDDDTSVTTLLADSKDSKQNTASWKDKNAVKHLIHLRSEKLSPLFESTSIKNCVAWDKLAEALKKQNSDWIFSGVQCSNKWRELKRQFANDNENMGPTKSGAAPSQTCKFFDEMQAAIGDKPIIKPVGLASTLKRKSDQSLLEIANEACGSSNESDDGDNEDCKTVGLASRLKEKKESKKENNAKDGKKSRLDKQLADLTSHMREEAAQREAQRARRHEEQMQRQDKALDAYTSFMSRLLEKL